MAPEASTPLVVVGMASEARIARRIGRSRIGTAGLEPELITKPSLVISFGLCGGLDTALPVGALLVGIGVTDDGEVLTCDPALTEAIAEATGARRALFVGANGILATKASKRALRARSNADAIDLESREVALAARRMGVPFAILRAVSDSAEDALPRAAVAGFRPDGGVDIVAVLANLARRPWELRGLVRTGLNAGAAMRALSGAADRVGGLWG